MTDTDDPVTADDQTAKRLAFWVRSRAVRRARAGVPAWSLVSDVLGHGCTSANGWCLRHGIDPNMPVKGLG